MSRSRRRAGRTPASAGGERSGPEAEAGARRGRPGRRTAAERTEAVLVLLSGKATADQLASRFGVAAVTILKWRDDALQGIAEAMCRGEGRSAREIDLERQLGTLEKAFTRLAMKHELVERAMQERPSVPGRSSR